MRLEGGREFFSPLKQRSFFFTFFCRSVPIDDPSLFLSYLAPTMAPPPPNLNRQIFKVNQRVLVPYTDKYYEAKVSGKTTLHG